MINITGSTCEEEEFTKKQATGSQFKKIEFGKLRLSLTFGFNNTAQQVTGVASRFNVSYLSSSHVSIPLNIAV